MPKKKRIAVLVACVSVCLLGYVLYCAGGRQLLEIPVEIQDNRLFVRSNIGRVLLDTGSPIAFVDRHFAERTGFKQAGRSVTVTDLSGAVVESELFEIQDFAIVDATESGGWDIPAFHAAAVEGLEHRMGAGLVLGLPVFDGVIVDMDIPKGELRLLKNLPFGWNCTRVSVREAEGSALVPIVAEGSGSFWTVLDTGNGGFFDFCPEDWSSIPHREDTEKQIVANTILGFVSSLQARANCTLTVGNLSVMNAPISRNAGSKWNLVGLSVLRHTRIAIDWDNRAAVFVAPSMIFKKYKITIGRPLPKPQ